MCFFIFVVEWALVWDSWREYRTAAVLYSNQQSIHSSSGQSTYSGYFAKQIVLLPLSLILVHIYEICWTRHIKTSIAMNNPYIQVQNNQLIQVILLKIEFFFLSPSFLFIYLQICWTRQFSTKTRYLFDNFLMHDNMQVEGSKLVNWMLGSGSVTSGK